MMARTRNTAAKGRWWVGAVVAVALAACPSAGAIPRANTQRFHVTLHGTQRVDWTFHDYNADPNCGGTADGHGSEKLVFANSRPVTVTALQVGHSTPFLIAGRTGGFNAKGTYHREASNSFQPNPGGNGCSSGTPGAQPPPPDCGTKPFDRMVLQLEYVGARERQRPTTSPYTTEYVGFRKGNLLDLTYQASAESVDPFEDLFQNCAASGPKVLLEAYNSILSPSVLMGHRHTFSVRGGRYSVSQFAGTKYIAHLDWTIKFMRLRPRR